MPSMSGISPPPLSQWCRRYLLQRNQGHLARVTQQFARPPSPGWGPAEKKPGDGWESPTSSTNSTRESRLCHFVFLAQLNFKARYRSGFKAVIQGRGSRWVLVGRLNSVRLIESIASVSIGGGQYPCADARYLPASHLQL